MIKNAVFFKILLLIIAIIIILITVAIIINSPYYNGFEHELDYLSPDLSENRTVLRDNFEISRKSQIKIVFEEKDNFKFYDKEQFDSFINDLEVQIWNDNEYFSFNKYKLDYDFKSLDFFVIKIGDLISPGEYSIYINSDLGFNTSFHIGIGVGRESRFIPLGKNQRNFY